jgi:hypothetical protein
MYLDYVVQCQQLSHAVGYLSSCKGRNCRHLALEGLKSRISRGKII